jgi:hypothetical protein
MAKSCMGAVIQYCGHNGCFLADIWEVGNTNVVHASREVTVNNLERPAQGCTHHMSDFPVPGFWKPHRGIFVVPANQVKEL